MSGPGSDRPGSDLIDAVREGRFSPDAPHGSRWPMVDDAVQKEIASADSAEVATSTGVCEDPSYDSSNANRETEHGELGQEANTCLARFMGGDGICDDRLFYNAERKTVHCGKAGEVDQLACGVDFYCTVRMAAGGSFCDTAVRWCGRCFGSAEGVAAKAKLSRSSALE